MKPYTNYKPSNIEWIGKIPEHWGTRKIAWSFNLIGSGTTPKSDSDLYYENGSNNWLLTGDLTDGEIYNTSKKITELALLETSSLKKYPVNSVVMAMYGATIGKLGILKIETTTNQACCVLANSPYFDYKYVFYWLLVSRQSIINLSYGGGQPNINQDIVKGLRLTFPPLPEQQAIVSYLDTKTTLIDELISKKEQKIELLKENRTAIINHAVTKGLDPTVKYKDSGIEWIGEIPEHWEVSSFKYFINLRHGYQFRDGDFTDSGIKIIKITQLDKEGYLNIENCSTIHRDRLVEFSNILIKENDILMCLTGGTIGKIIKVGEVNQPLLQNYRVGHFSSINKKAIVNDFIFYLMSSQVILGQIFYDVRETGQPNIGLEDMNRMKICVPLILEQQQIVAYLDEQTALIDQSISLEQQKIEKLKEYRQSLISNVVTGKICVL